VNNTYEGSKGDVKLSAVKGYGTNVFSNNGGYGIRIYSLGSVTLQNLEANENDNIGVLVNNNGSLAGKQVILVNVVANDNPNNGIYILSTGQVMFKGVEAQRNTGYGVYIDNTFNSGTGDVKIITTSKDGTGLVAKSNTREGLYVITNGNITIMSSTISSNGSDGAYLYNLDNDGKSVTLTNVDFDDNANNGVTIQTTGSITWNSGGASGNLAGYGANLTNNTASTYQSVKISSADFGDNYSYGLNVSSRGAITLNIVGASNNRNSYGVYLDNCQLDSGLCTGSGDIYIRGWLQTDGFSNNAICGIQAYSNGNITLINTIADNNGQDGLYLTNDYDSSTGSITIKTTAKNIYNGISSNGNNGLSATTNGKIYLSNLSAHNNTNYGIYVSNETALSDLAVTLLRIESGDNGVYGVKVVTKGAIYLNHAEDSGYEIVGIYLDNTASTTGQGVTIYDTEVNGNSSGTGLYVTSTGDIDLITVSATNNATGANIMTSGVDATITFLNKWGDNVFSNNLGDGLVVEANGGINLTGVISEWNGSDGVNATTSGALKVKDVYLYRNSGDGLETSATSVTMNNLRSYNNSSDGISLSEITNAKMSGCVISGNYGDGIQLVTGSVLDLYKTTYFGNDADNTGDENIHYITLP